MGLLDRLLGREERQPPPAGQGYPEQGYGGQAYSQGYAGQGPGGYPQDTPGRSGPQGPVSDEAAIERYRYLLRTAPPETIEQAHAEAFAQLTPEQRSQVLEQLSSQVPAAERAGADDPRSLARMATRAEMRNPGTLERSFAGSGMGGGMGGIGMGGMLAGSLLASVAGAFIGTAIADSMFDMSDSGDSGAEAGGDGAEAGADGGEGGDYAADGGDYGGGDYGGGDYGGGDFGGGDFGGGEF